MKATTMGVIISGALLASGCATIQSVAMAGLGAPSGVAVTSIHERGLTYVIATGRRGAFSAQTKTMSLRKLRAQRLNPYFSRNPIR